MSAGSVASSLGETTRGPGNETEERIASFFEDQPYFYDLSHESYKNKKLRAAELAEFAATLGPKWDGKCAVTNCKCTKLFIITYNY